MNYRDMGDQLELTAQEHRLLDAELPAAQAMMDKLWKKKLSDEADATVARGQAAADQVAEAWLDRKRRTGDDG